MRKHQVTYWIFQVSGWALYTLINIFFYLAFRTIPQPHFYEQLATHFMVGFTLTHCMRFFIQQTGILNLKIKSQFFYLIITALLFSFLIGSAIVAAERILRIQSPRIAEFSFINISIRFAFSYFHFVLIWNLLYFAYHYVQKTRQQNLDQVRLENLLKELEITTLKAHINPQFIFNGLNSIRELVLNNPARARSAITQLSNILRSSIQVDKAEKNLLEKDLHIVKDYLSLEEIRFNNRLTVQYDIEDDCLDMEVPAMALQALTENAVKYAMVDENSTGNLEVFAREENNWLKVGVRSTGNIMIYTTAETSSIDDIRKRLQMLYGPQAKCIVQSSGMNSVEAFIQLPA